MRRIHAPDVEAVRADVDDLRAGIAAIERAMAAGRVGRRDGEAEIARMRGELARIEQPERAMRTAALFGAEAT